MEHASIERVLRLMRLMGGNINFTIEELATKLQTSERTIYRYIDTLKEAGFVVQKLHGTYYRIMKMPGAHRTEKRSARKQRPQGEPVQETVREL